MVALSRVVKAALALTVSSVVIGCGALIGIEDGVADPGSGAPDATSIDSAPPDAGAKDTSTPDTSTTPDAAPGPIAKPGGDTTTLPCGGMTCPIPAESCCAYRTTAQPSVYIGQCSATCAPPGGVTDRLANLKCSGPSNCPSATPRCCYSNNSGTVETICKANCGFQDEVLCDPNGTGQCGSTRSCGHFSGQTMPPSWGYCQ